MKKHFHDIPLGTANTHPDADTNEFTALFLLSVPFCSRPVGLSRTHVTHGEPRASTLFSPLTSCYPFIIIRILGSLTFSCCSIMFDTRSHGFASIYIPYPFHILSFFRPRALLLPLPTLFLFTLSISLRCTLYPQSTIRKPQYIIHHTHLTLTMLSYLPT